MDDIISQLKKWQYLKDASIIYYATWPQLKKGTVIRVSAKEKVAEWILFNPEDLRELRENNPDFRFVHLTEYYENQRRLKEATDQFFNGLTGDNNEAV